MHNKNIISGISTWFVLFAALFLVILRLFGFCPYYIMSPSMTPTYQVGDLVFVKHEAPEQIKQGDAITFLAADGQTVVTHRVWQADNEKHEFITKGDANESPDAVPVSYDRVIGTVVLGVPKLGFLSAVLSSKAGMLGLVTLVLFVFLISFIRG